MKLWNKGQTTSEKVHLYTVGNDRFLDHKLAKYDVLGSIAHGQMLHKVGLISTEEIDLIIPALKSLLNLIEKDEFLIEEEFEDIHSKVEFELIKLVGECGKKIHTARSRNDQVLVDLHLYAKNELAEINKLTQLLFSNFIELADKYSDIILPGYTHTQVAMPSSFGLWFSAYAECLIDDLQFLKAAETIADQNPLGSAAGYGSSFPIDREMTTQLLGFSQLKINSVAAQMSRGKLEKSVSFALASLANTLSKFSADICLYMSQNFGFIGFPDELTTGSSIMPHKKNPDVFEVMRAKCNIIQNIPAQLSMISNNLTSGYHRDFQLLKEPFMNCIEMTKESLEMCIFMLEHIQVNKNITSAPKYDFMYSVENVNELVQQGINFRDAYHQIGKMIAQDEFYPKTEIDHKHVGSIGNLGLDKIKKKMELTGNPN